MEELLEQFRAINFIPKKERVRAFARLANIYDLPFEAVKDCYEQSRENKIIPIYNIKYFENNKEYCITKTMTRMGEHYPHWYSLVKKRDEFYFNIFLKNYEEVDLKEKHQRIITNLIKKDYLKVVHKDNFGEIYTPEGLSFKDIL